jgi:hypothetical protein
VTNAIVEGVTRLLELMAQPEDADLLRPLVVDEILIRLLRAPRRARFKTRGPPTAPGG